MQNIQMPGAAVPVQVDPAQIRQFANALFRYARPDTWVSLRSFPDTRGSGRPFETDPVQANLKQVVDRATAMALRCATEPDPVVFCPPVVTFKTGQNAKGENVAQGLALSVECDAAPSAARKCLEAVLGDATLVVASGGAWTCPETGEMQYKLHLHWRLACPTETTIDHERLKYARKLATELVSADGSNVPLVHPIRWPGSIHRKGAPRLTQIIAAIDAEIDLSTSLDRLSGATGQAAAPSTPTRSAPVMPVDPARLQEVRMVLAKFIPPSSYAEWQPLVAAIHHATRGSHDGLALAQEWSARDPLKYNGKQLENQWRSYSTDRPSSKTIATLYDHAKRVGVDMVGLNAFVSLVKQFPNGPGGYLPPGMSLTPVPPEFVAPPESVAPTDPVDLWGHFPAPDMPEGLLPPVIEEWARINAAQMGADPAGLAAAALVTCAAALSDVVKIKVKRHSDWTESARLWVALVGPPSAKKSPIIKEATRPLIAIDMQMMRAWQKRVQEFDDLSPKEKKGKVRPSQTRLRIGDATVEAAQQVLQGSPWGVLLLQDELSGFFGAMDKYGGGKGAQADRAFWLQSFNGGDYALNRVARGSAIIENLSVSMLGGIQPGPLRKVSGDTVDDGLLQRLFPIMLRTATMGHEEPTPPVNHKYKGIIEALSRLTDATPLQFDDGAQAIRRDLEAEHLKLQSLETLNGKLASHIGKYDGLFARLALLFHCVDHVAKPSVGPLPRTVTEATARRAATFLHRFLMRHAVAFYAGTLGRSDDHDRLAAIAGYIIAHKLEIVTNRHVQRGDRTMRGLKDSDIRPLLEQLATLGWLDQTPGPRASSAPHWAVNPAVHIKFAERGQREAERRKQAMTAIQQINGASEN